jgi:hypothetical protein
MVEIVRIDHPSNGLLNGGGARPHNPPAPVGASRIGEGVRGVKINLFFDMSHIL